MVKTSKKSTLPESEWTKREIPLNPDAVAQLNGIFYSLQGEKTAAYLDYLAEATGSGRYQQSEELDPWMTWEMAREMKAAGMDFGAHTVNHSLLARLTPEEQLFEIKESQKRVSEELKMEIDTFSFPVGKPNTFNEATRNALKQCGIRWAFSYYGGYNPTGTFDEYDLKRFPIELKTSLSFIRSAVSFPQVFSNE